MTLLEIWGFATNFRLGNAQLFELGGFLVEMAHFSQKIEPFPLSVQYQTGITAPWRYPEIVQVWIDI